MKNLEEGRKRQEEELRIYLEDRCEEIEQKIRNTIAEMIESRKLSKVWKEFSLFVLLLLIATIICLILFVF